MAARRRAVSAPHDGVLIVRDDGVIPVATAIPWPAQLAQQIEHTLDAVLEPRGDDKQQRTEDD